VCQQRRQPLLYPAPFGLAVVEPATQIANRLGLFGDSVTLPAAVL
jgi:hypothetical protein